MRPTAAHVRSSPESPDASSFALELLGIVKSYGAVMVLHGLDLRIRRGSIHALLGANGAGKSTLLKIAVGATEATAGRIVVNGAPRRFSGTLEARQAGIGMVFQERSIAPDLSVVDNLFLNSEIRRAGLVDVRAERREAGRMFERLGVRIPLGASAGQLGIADQQMVEIAKAVRLASAVLILDEPTAALTQREVQRLFGVVRQIAKTGVGIAYVSHRLAEVFELCDEVTIIRDGRVVLARPVAETHMDEVVEAIAGGVVAKGRLARAAGTPDGGAQARNASPLLAVRGLRVDPKLREVSFDLQPAEILGVAGLAGSGRSTLLGALFGLVPRSAGELRVAGRPVSPTSPAAAIGSGFYLIPEDRKTQGLVLSHSVAANIVLSVLHRLRVGPLVSASRSLRLARDVIRRFRIRPPEPATPVGWLSGGNQQKTVLGKAFSAGGRILLLDEPTFGVDIHSRAEIRAHIRAFADAGNAVVWVTSDLRELIDIADRILVLADGKVTDIVSNWPQRTEAEITHLIQGSNA
jgi:ABC-type sugar transport system ATPase subunit